jgi:16S rRNA (cytosine1402-N4)-methyltransferase
MITLAPPVRRAAIRTVKPQRPEYHQPVLVAETLALLAPAPGRRIVDGTLGGGGHSAALLAAGATVAGIDQDPAALAFAGTRLAQWSARFVPVRGNFADADALLDAAGFSRVDGALLDLGVSSHQLDTAARGFSFQQDGPLDMRMNPDGPVTAAHLVNTMSSEQLERIFRELGEEPAARRIAARLVRDRLVQPFETTRQLAATIEAMIPRRGHAHPATRVFQALRMAVNREMEALERGLEAITRRLAPGGVFAVITFHSIEDRLVKNFFKLRATEWLDRPDWPEPRRNPEYECRLLTRKPVVASAEEQRMNPRSRSAKLRAAARLET